MKLHNTKEIEEFKNIINNAEGDIWMEDAVDGTVYDLSDELTQYTVIGLLLHDNDLELFANSAADEAVLLAFLSEMDEAVAA